MPFIGEKEPKDIVPFEIDRIRIKMSKALKAQTIKLTMALIKRLSNFGKAKQLCDGINFIIEMPKVNNIKTEDISPEQLLRRLEILENNKNTIASNLMKLALFTGMRRSELFRLKWEDVNFQRGCINIRNPKGGKDQTIPLSNSARTVLEKHIKSTSHYIFPGIYGKRRSEIKKPINGISRA
jgi:integrase